MPSKTMSEEYLENLQELSNEEQIYELASLFFTPVEIADFVGLAVDDFISLIKFVPDDPYAVAYRKGVMDTRIKLRFNTKRFALSGSPEAINSMRDYHSKQSISEII